MEDFGCFGAVWCQSVEGRGLGASQQATADPLQRRGLTARPGSGHRLGGVKDRQEVPGDGKTGGLW